MLKSVAMMVPQLRRVREHIHRLDALYRQAQQEANTAAHERDEARARVLELEQALAEAQAAASETPPAPVDNSMAELVEALRQELVQLEAAYRASVQLNNELMGRLPFRAAA